MSSPLSIHVGDVIASKYSVERVLGQGAMGVVVAARHQQLGFPVALKFMLPGAVGDEARRERFLREARAVGSLRGENIARVSDFGVRETGEPYIVMEFLEGRDLFAVLAERGPLPPAEAVEYVLQACKGIDEAHRQGLVHRDLKPQNLFLTRRPDGTPLVKVLDFGVAKVLVDTLPSQTKTSALMGSPLYMSPEQLRSSKDVDARTDIYALGVVLYQLVSGATPFDASTLGEVAEKIQRGDFPPLRARAPRASAQLEAVVSRCMASDRNARFASATELMAALASTAEGPMSAVSAQRMSGAGAPPIVVASGGPVSGLDATAPMAGGRHLTESRTGPGAGPGRWIVLVAIVGVLAATGAVGLVVLGRSAPGKDESVQLGPGPVTPSPAATTSTEPASTAALSGAVPPSLPTPSVPRIQTASAQPTAGAPHGSSASASSSGKPASAAPPASSQPKPVGAGGYDPFSQSAGAPPSGGP
jgi:predicted Ser/Thr protein kinase